ncbi:hypothetical protein SAMD00019534_051450 [Acytostelium subglobosum LB1]|uniref:hypothetical protein n=1 Tax=Acytostelium subglobosum LB1 TaxID=1410327 RepID=UPI000644FEF1|nr:hypothetical protein SAMD00019534_051450 [Acytostelium subglobosum LB1]GAM21970.1 hypothetical protein SAMD00019534_051450 [Acytostelium subglobosum LB1]|eukprot:XP_012755070.1 hypothetical protein SAMD00019534_051450 [Acytostelium subglobosum LB1]
MNRDESKPAKSFTFVVDSKVKETAPSRPLTKFDYKALDKTYSKVARSSVEKDSPSIVHIGDHAFIHSAILAYNQHMHLVIRPDDIWLALITQFSFYVNANAETLRTKFVAHDGKKELEVKSGGTLHTAPYEHLAMMMTDQIAANIKDPSVRDWVLPSFTTTSNTDRVVGAFALMATLKKYFDYKFSLCCGLPKVTIMGTVEDWTQVRQRVERFVEFDGKERHMKKWVDMLLPVLDNMIKSANGKPDTKWWNQIANYVGGGSGPTWVSGWIGVFMVFNDEGKWQGDMKKVQFWNQEIKSEWPLVDTSDIPKGYVSCPLKIDDNGTMYDTEIYAGHLVSKLINDNTTIVPQLDWCILVKDQPATV